MECMYCSLCKERPYLSEGKIQLYPKQHTGASLVAQMVKNLPAMWETWVWSLGREDPLKKEKATHSSILAWRILAWTIQSMGVSKSWTGLNDFSLLLIFLSPLPASLETTHFLMVSIVLPFPGSRGVRSKPCVEFSDRLLSHLKFLCGSSWLVSFFLFRVE